MAQTRNAAHLLWVQTDFPTNTRQGHPCPTFSPKAGEVQTSPVFINTIPEDRPNPVRPGAKWLLGGCVRVKGVESRVPTKATAGNWKGREASMAALDFWGPET